MTGDYPATDAVGKVLNKVMRAPNRWSSTFLRRAYVVTWPLSWLTRGVLLFALGIMFVLALLADSARWYLYCTWTGEKYPWA